MKKTYLGLPLILGLALSGGVSFAQDRNLGEAEINGFFEAFLLKQESIADTDDIELEDEQREEIAKQISYDYTDDAVIKFKHRVLTEKNHHSPIMRGAIDVTALQSSFKKQSKVRNMSTQFDVKEVNIMGQRADAKVNIIYTYQIIGDDYDDPVKFSLDAMTKAECDYKMKVDYDDAPRITYENCDVRTFASNIDYELPDYMDNDPGRGIVKVDQYVIFNR